MPRTPQELKDAAKAARDAARAAEQERSQQESELAEAQAEAWTLISLRLLDLMEQAVNQDADIVTLLLAINPLDNVPNAEKVLEDAVEYGHAHAMVSLQKNYE